MTRQLALDLPLRPALGREAFFVAPSNAAAVAALDTWRTWPGGRMVLSGPGGSGKSHLAQVFAQDSGAVVVPATALARADVAELSPGAVVVEDVPRIAGDPAAEEALLHLWNLAGETGGRLLLTGRGDATDWRLRLPDLSSRVVAGPRARLEPPCDRLLAALLVKLFADRQLRVAPTLIDYLVPRIERSGEAAAAIVARLDAAALARGQAVSRPLAAELLAGRAGPS